MKKFNKFLMLAVFLLIGWATAFSQTATEPSGDGSENNPYLIATVENYYWLTQTSSVWNGGYYFKQTADIDASASATWASGSGASAIGSSSIKFNGHYDGQNHTISGITINRSSEQRLGLFGQIDNAEIENLGVVDIAVNAYYYGGGLAAYANASRFTNCYVTGTVSGSYVGGFAGYCASNNKCVSCYFDGDVTGTNKYTGGFTGYSSKDTLISCSAFGIVTGVQYTGGLVGYNIESVDSLCYFSGVVTSSSTAVGGLCGQTYTRTKISNCYANGKVVGTGTVGGLVGMNQVGSTLTNTYFIGNVNGTSSYVGGFVGSLYEENATLDKGYVFSEVNGGSLVAGRNSDGIISDIYYNSSIAGTVIGDGSATSLTGVASADMMKAASFSALDFTNTWSITEGASFPCLQNITNVPVIFTLPDSTISTGVTYTATVEAYGMDNQNITLSLVDAPDGMTISGNVISWTPTISGVNLITVKVTDGNGASSITNYTLKAISYGGSGTAEDPYQIDDVYELDMVRAFLDKHYVLIADLDLTGTKFAADGSEAGFSPIGSKDEPFTGSFKGNGYTISNLYINAASDDYVGLFGYAQNAVIDSVGIINCELTGNQYVGPFVGYFKASSMNACFATGKITDSYGYVGGIVGYNYTSSSLTNVYSNVVISKKSKAYKYFGGIAGYSRGSIKNAYAVGVINTNDTYVGGLVGYNYTSGIIENAYLSGSVSTTGTSYVSGVVGRQRGTLTNVFYNSDIVGMADSEATALTTAQMMLLSNFTNFPSSDWSINEGTSYPCINAVHDFPIAYEVNDTVSSTDSTLVVDLSDKVMKMDYAITSYAVVDGETGMAVSSDGKFSWQPSAAGTYTVNVKAIDSEGGYCLLTFDVMAYSFKGEGTSSNPFQITTVDELAMVDLFLDQNFVLMNNLDIAGSDYDATNSTEGFAPIGTASEAFTGSFNGKGHVIKNLYINQSSTDNVGLFGYVEGATLDSLVLVDCNITGKANTGGLAGYCSKSVISNSSVSGSVNGKGKYIGGVVGYAIDCWSDYSGKIINSYSTADVTSSADYAGGFAGYINSCDITSIYATGNVASTGNSVGGLLGYVENWTYLYKSYAAGAVSGADNVGGLIGSIDQSLINDCYATGGANGTSNVGGLIGYRNSTASGASSDDAAKYVYAVGAATGTTNVGGLIGKNVESGSATTATIYDSYYNAETSKDSLGIGSDDSTLVVIAYSSAQMKQLSNFSNFNSSTWGTIENGTYPALKSVNNAPYAFADSIGAWYSVKVSDLMTNDFDYESAQEGLFLTIESIAGAEIINDIICFDDTIKTTDTISISYRVGEIVAATGDTLLGNLTNAVLYLENTDLVDSLSTEEGTTAYLNLNSYDAKYANTYEIAEDPTNGTASIVNDSLVYVPTAYFNGNDTCVVKMTNSLYVDSVTVYITVTPTNDAPIITSKADTTAVEGVEYSYQVAVTEPDGDALTYSLSSEPTGMAVSTSGLITWTSATGVTTSGEVTLTVSDGVLFDTETFTIAVNCFPVITSTADTVVNEGESYSYQVTATDANNDALTYSLENAPSTMAVSTSGMVVWIPANDATTSGEVTLVVSDGRISATQIFTVNVNNAPVITSTAGTIATEGVEYTYQVTATDANSDSLIYTLSNEPSGMTVSDKGLISWTPTSGTTTSGEVTLTVSDASLEAIEKFTITVSPASGVVEVESVSFNVYPNPVVGNTITLESANAEDGVVSIYSLTGKVVMQQSLSLTNCKAEINVSNLSKGIYMVHFADSVVKLVK